MFCAFFARRNKAKENQMKKKTLVYIAKGSMQSVQAMWEIPGRIQDVTKL